MGQPAAISQAAYHAAVSRLLAGLDAGLDTDAFRAILLLQQAADSAREFESRECLERFSLTWTQFEVLWNIWIFGEREAGWVARAAMVSKSGLTTILSGLERRGLLVRSADPTDGRKSLVRLSDKGTVVMRQVLARLNRADSAFASPLDADQRRQLIQLLSALLAGPAAQPFDPR
jgi:MarR family transcriptional regulator, organic hydroperoxide resistance regulator